MQRNTLAYRKLSQKLKKGTTTKIHVGRPFSLSLDEEQMFINYSTKMSEFGYPVSQLDLRNVVKNYLDRCGRKILFNCTICVCWTHFLKLLQFLFCRKSLLLI